MPGDPLTLRQLYREAVALLASPFEADWLLYHATGFRAHRLPEVGNAPATAAQQETVRTLCRRRLSGVPLQYLLGEWEFWGLPFAVGEGVLIPRPDTETLVEAALSAMEGIGNPHVLDLCAGSGCVAISVAHERPDAVVTGLELSEAALAFFRRNIERNRVDVLAVQGDVAHYTPGCLQDVVTANPPYIPTPDLASLQQEVRSEPPMALDGGEDGLDFYRLIARRCRAFLKPGGTLCFEVGINQAGSVVAILDKNGYANSTIIDDLAGIGRVVTARRDL